MKTKTTQTDQRQSQHQVPISTGQALVLDLIVTVEPQHDKGDVGEGVDEFRDVDAVGVVVFAPVWEQA